MYVSTRSTKKSPLKKYNKNPAEAAGFFAVVRLAGWLKSRMNGVKSRMNGLRSRMNSEKSRMNSVKSRMNSAKSRTATLSNPDVIQNILFYNFIHNLNEMVSN